MFEVEKKYELTQEQFADLLTALHAHVEYACTDEREIEDCFIDINPSLYGGWDFLRLRRKGKYYFSTLKQWELVEGKKTRRETEQEIPENEFLQSHPNARVVMQKTRISFRGSHQGHPLVLDLDTLTLSSGKRYFVEAEIVVENPHAIALAEQQIDKWFIEFLGISDQMQAPTMLDIALQESTNTPN